MKFLVLILKKLLYWVWNVYSDDEYEDDEDSQEELDSCEITGVSGPAAGLLLSELLACRELEDLEVYVNYAMKIQESNCQALTYRTWF